MHNYFEITSIQITLFQTLFGYLFAEYCIPNNGQVGHRLNAKFEPKPVARMSVHPAHGEAANGANRMSICSGSDRETDVHMQPRSFHGSKSQRGGRFAGRSKKIPRRGHKNLPRWGTLICTVYRVYYRRRWGWRWRGGERGTAEGLKAGHAVKPESLRAEISTWLVRLS